MELSHYIPKVKVLTSSLKPIFLFIFGSLVGFADSQWITTDGKPAQFVSCYSCMAATYLDDWEALQHVYHRPKTFSDRCNHPFVPRGMPTENCSDICVTLREPTHRAGVPTGDLYIRGCLNRILRKNFNMSAILTHRFKMFDTCRSLPRRQLFDEPYMQGEVTLCSCYSNQEHSLLKYSERNHVEVLLP